MTAQRADSESRQGERGAAATGNDSEAEQPKEATCRQEQDVAKEHVQRARACDRAKGSS